jgi:hypothetical protein
MSVQHKIEAMAAMLEHVRWTSGRAAFRAQCPAHRGGRDTLSVRIHPREDRLQIVCFAECGALAVLNAIGLRWDALYPDRDRVDHRIRKAPPPPYRDALVAMDFEAHLVATMAGRMEAGHALTPRDTARLALAAARIDAARRVAGARI